MNLLHHPLLCLPVTFHAPTSGEPFRFRLSSIFSTFTHQQTRRGCLAVTGLFCWHCSKAERGHSRPTTTLPTLHQSLPMLDSACVGNHRQVAVVATVGPLGFQEIPQRFLPRPVTSISLGPSIWLHKRFWLSASLTQKVVCTDKWNYSVASMSSHFDRLAFLSIQAT